MNFDPENMGLDIIFVNMCNIGRDKLKNRFVNSGGIYLHTNDTWDFADLLT